MQIINEKYKNKYLKYKNKYYNLTKNKKKQTGGDALLVGTFVSIIGLIVLALLNRDKFKLSKNVSFNPFRNIKVLTKKDNTQPTKSQTNLLESKKLYDFDAKIRDDIDRQNKNTLKNQTQVPVQPQVKPNVQPPVKPLVQTSGVDPPAAASDDADDVGDDEDKAAIKLNEFKKFLLRSRLDSFKKNFKQLSCKICITK